MLLTFAAARDGLPMPTVVPPALPTAQTGQNPPDARINFRVQQIALSIITVGVTVWLWTIHPVIGIAATFIAKHLLVAILATGLSYPAIREEGKP